MSGNPLGGASFGPGRGAAGGAPLSFAAATAFLLAIAVVAGVIAARTTVRRDVTSRDVT